MRLLLLASLLLGWVGPGLAAEPAELGTICGRVQAPGIEMYSGVVSLWDAEQIPMPDPRRYVLIPTQAGLLEPDGRFLLRAPAGRYYLGAVVRQTPGPPLGPPRVGDLVFMTPDARDEALVVEVKAGARVDVGDQGGGWVYPGFSAGAVTGIAGRVTDREGLAQAGLLVFAFRDPEMSGQPLAVSDRTDAQGRYLLRLPGGGEVYLRVRDNYGGGAPVGGGIMGVYGDAAPRPVPAVGGKVLEGIDIATLRIPALRSGERAPDGRNPGPDRTRQDTPSPALDPEPSTGVTEK